MPLPVKQRDQGERANRSDGGRRLDQSEDDTAQAKRGEDAAREIGALALHTGPEDSDQVAMLIALEEFLGGHRHGLSAELVAAAGPLASKLRRHVGVH